LINPSNPLGSCNTFLLRNVRGTAGEPALFERS
jgi:hypothetical protein